MDIEPDINAIRPRPQNPNRSRRARALTRGFLLTRLSDAGPASSPARLQRAGVRNPSALRSSTASWHGSNLPAADQRSWEPIGRFRSSGLNNRVPVADRARHSPRATKCTIVLAADDGSCLRIRKAATPEPDVLDLYRCLDLSPRIMKPQQTWTPGHSD
jgi:hypothetical protein